MNHSTWNKEFLRNRVDQKEAVKYHNWSLMEDLPESLLSEIIKRIDRIADRNSLSLVCRRLYIIEGQQRGSLRVGCGLHPATDALVSLCTRFPNLVRLDIGYSGWMSNMGKQLDNHGLSVLSSHCPSLIELTLSFCSFIGDSGLGHLASCRNLRTLRLNFAPSISSNGILSLVVGCKKLSTLHLIRCMKVTSAEWLEYLGKFGMLEDLSIKNCRGVGEDDLMKLGPGWNKIKWLDFEVDADYRYPKVFDHPSTGTQLRRQICCEMLKELCLINCTISSVRGLSCLLGKCGALEKLRLDMCIGLKDSDMIALSRKSSNLRCFSLRLPSQLYAPLLANIPMCLTDESLKALACGGSVLEEVELSFLDAEFPSFTCFSQNGIISLIESCPIRVLAFTSTYFFNDVVMAALCSAHFLQRLELVKCQEVSDDGMQLIVHFPCLVMLKLCKCLGVTDIGLQPLVYKQKLESLTVEDCPQISERGVQGTAKVVSYKQDMSWLY